MAKEKPDLPPSLTSEELHQRIQDAHAKYPPETTDENMTDGMEDLPGAWAAELADDQPHPRAPVAAYRVARRNAEGRLEAAFVLARRAGGDTALLQMRMAIADHEQDLIFEHFDQAHQIRSGGHTRNGRDIQVLKTVGAEPSSASSTPSQRLTRPPPPRGGAVAARYAEVTATAGEPRLHFLPDRQPDSLPRQ